MSHAMPSSRILTAWGAGTLRERSLMRSRALRMEAGSYVLRVVLTVMLPSIRSSVQSICSELAVNLRRCCVQGVRGGTSGIG